MPTYGKAIVRRLPLAIAGGYAMWWQVQLIREYAGTNTTMLWVAPAACMLGALCPTWIEEAWRERRVPAAAGFFLLLAFSIGMSLSGALGRVAELRATKSSDALSLKLQHADAQRVADQADAAVTRQQEAVDKWCIATTTQETVSGSGKRRVVTESKAIAVQCEPARAELAVRNTAATEAHRKLDAAKPVPKADADVRGIAEFFHLPYETVEVYQPAGWPLLLELTMLVTFGFAFRPLEYDSPSDHSAAPQEWPANVVSLSRMADGLVTDLQVVAGLIKLWIDAEGIADVPIKEGCDRFNEWLKRQKNLVGSRTFSAALKAGGITTRSKGGRVLIAGPDYKPRTPAKRKMR